MQIGFVGLGSMGHGIATNLLRNGHELIVFDVLPAACEELVQAGARSADSPKQLAAQSEVVFTSLPTPAIVESVCWDEAGLAAGSPRAVPGSTCRPTRFRWSAACTSSWRRWRSRSSTRR